MLVEIAKELSSEFGDMFQGERVLDIEVLAEASHPNSRIQRLRFTTTKARRTLYVKFLHPDQVDGRSNRGDLEFKKRQVQTEFDVLNTLFARFASSEELGVVRPVACFPEKLALVTEEHPGVSLETKIGCSKVYSGSSAIRHAVRLCFQCGKWLKMFQGFLPAPEAHGFDSWEIVDYCRVRLGILEERRPKEVPGKLAAKVLAVLAQDVGSFRGGQGAVTGRHNDYGPYNMIVDGERLVVLDFAGFSYGPKVCDFVKFWSVLERMRSSPLASGNTVAAFQEAFVDGYGSRPEPESAGFRACRLAGYLDKMGDIVLDWHTFPNHRKLLYGNLFRIYLEWVRQYASGMA